MNGCQAARSGGKIVFKGLYSGLAGNLAGVLPFVTSRTLSLSLILALSSYNGIWLFKEHLNNRRVVCLLWWMMITIPDLPSWKLFLHGISAQSTDQGAV